MTGPDLAKLTAEITACVDGYRVTGDDGATWEASSGDRVDELTVVRLTQDGAAEIRTIRVRLEERG